MSTATPTTTAPAQTTSSSRQALPAIDTQPRITGAENKNVQTQRRWSLTLLVLILGTGAALAGLRHHARRPR